MARASGGKLPWSTTNLVKSDTFGEFKRGDKVRVLPEDSDVQGRFDGARFEFLAHVTNIENGKQWVDLWGGPPRHEALVSVRPSRVAHA